MDEKDISVKVGQDAITIEGFRGPTPEHLQLMNATVREKYKALTGKDFDYVCLDEDQDQFLLQLGAGRFGTFSETFELPPHIDIDNITSSYRSGRLMVRLPFKQQERKTLPHRHPAHPFFGTPFFDDSDFFWK